MLDFDTEQLYTNRTVETIRSFAAQLENMVTQSSSIHMLRASLEAARLQTVEELAGKVGSLPTDLLQRIALLQSVLVAVREEIEAHDVRIGGGSEQPLK
jgi:hypothetical protein